MAKSTARIVDNNGFMLVKGCPLSREGIYEYSAGQIGLEGDPNRIVKVYRPAEAVSDPATINSFKNVPLIDEHEMLNGIGGAHPEYTDPTEKGIDGVLTGNIWYDESDGWMKGDIKVFSRKLMAEFRNGKDDLSLGFGCTFYLTPGQWNGQDYEVVQINIRGNHLAVVDDGRVEGARVLDAMCFDSLNFHLNPNKDYDMYKGMKQTRRIIEGSAADSALDKLKALVPALQDILAECSNGAPAAAAEPAAEPAAAAPAQVDEEGAPPATATAEAPAPAPAEAAAEPDADPSATDPEDATVLVQQVEALLAQIKDMLGAAPAAAEAPVESPAPSGEPEASAEDNLDPALAENGKAQDNEDLLPEAAINLEGAKVVTPVVDGEDLNAAAHTTPATDEAPTEMEGAAQDAALNRFYADLDKKTKLYGRLSKVVGAFDASAMDSKAVGAYGAKKLGLKCEKGQEVFAVDTYLNGLAAGAKATATAQQTQRAAMDSRSACPELDAYLKKGN